MNKINKFLIGCTIPFVSTSSFANTLSADVSVYTENEVEETTQFNYGAAINYSMFKYLSLDAGVLYREPKPSVTVEERSVFPDFGMKLIYPMSENASVFIGGGGLLDKKDVVPRADFGFFYKLSNDVDLKAGYRFVYGEPDNNFVEDLDMFWLGLNYKIINPDKEQQASRINTPPKLEEKTVVELEKRPPQIVVKEPEPLPELIIDPTPIPVPEVNSCKYYRVEKEDWLLKISRTLGVSFEALINWNLRSFDNLRDYDLIYPEEIITVDPNGQECIANE
ncbi:LysM peptidoglycan-binding domain-containing protein [Vibrio sp. TRT 17S01]|uniref:LysM peptidoglycan-binding domain-containing protein n=1 Tax=Vibrio sp. TRT 17S01 TaxID=3418505 RepID=UPI003CFB42EC